MADQDVKQLLLQVDASIELLRANLGKADAAVKGSTDKWGKDADRADVSFSNVGKGLGSIAPRLREINNLTKQYGATNAQMAARSKAMQQQMESQAEQIASSIRRVAGAFGAYFSARELSQINDTYIEFTNQLRVSGVEGAQVKVVQDALFASAQKYGVELNSLGTLYGRTAQAAATLGASQMDLLRFTDGISAALKVQGGSTESASGALLQLSQALQAGTVRAEEFNSINEGAFPILQAVAAGSTRFAGSVAKLRAEVLEGTVTSKEFFQAFLAGSGMLEDRAAKSAMTAASGVVTLRNALEVYIGEASAANGVSAALGLALNEVATNIDVVIPAIAVLGAALGIGFVANAAKASVAARGAGAAILGAFGGPVGIAVTAITVAISSFAIEAARTSELVRQANVEFEETQQKLKLAAGAASGAASGAAAVGTGAQDAIPKVQAFAGAVGELAQRLYEQADAARKARVAMLEKQLTESQDKERELGARTSSGRAALQQDASNAFWSGDVLMAGKMTWQNFTGAAVNALSGGKVDRDTSLAYRQQASRSVLLQSELATARNAPLSAADLPGGGAPVAGAGGKGGKGPSAETLAKRAEAARQRDVRDEIQYQAELRRGRLEELSLQADATNDQVMRVDIERQRITLERDALAKEITADGPAKGGGTGRYSSDQVAELQTLNASIATARLAAVDTAERRRLAADALSIAQADRSNQVDLLQGESDLAQTLGERRDLELRILDLQIEEERARLEAVTIANGANATEVEIARKRLAMLDSLKGQEVEKINRDAESPLQQRRRQVQATFADMNTALENVELNALDRLSDGLDNAATKFVKLGGVAGDVVNSIIGDLVRLATQQALFGAGGSGGLFRSLGTFLGFSKGGYTGDIPEDDVAGVVHGQEYVFDAASVRRIGRDQLDAMRKGNFAMPSVSAATLAGSGGGGGFGGGTARVEIGLSADLDGYVASVAGDVAVAVYQAGAPGLVQTAKAATINELSRSRL